MENVEPLVTTDWLQGHLDDPSVRVIDCRGYVVTRTVEPGVEEADYRGAVGEYLSSHIPGAVYVDWTKDIIDPSDPVPVQVAGPEDFAKAMGSRGVGNETHVVAVDHSGGQFATRLWWVLQYYGHDRVSVLDGGWNRWVDEDRDVEAGEAAVEPDVFVPRVRPGLRSSAEDVLRVIGRDGVTLVDARDAAQYSGAKRRGPRGGHIPGARHVPREVFFAEGGGFPHVDEVRRRAVDAGLSPERPLVAYCNGGVAATVVLFNLYRLGFRDLSNYDGSWNEWGVRTDLPVETGAGS